MSTGTTQAEQRYCAKCGHPENDHGGPAGCDWEVSDWGTLDCGCTDFVAYVEPKVGHMDRPYGV